MFVRIKGLVGCLGLSLFLSGIGSEELACAQSPLANPFKRTVRESQEISTLKPEHGPWMIFVHSFEGDKAKEQATLLGKEIQKEFNLPAFVMEKKFDYSTKVLGSGYREDGTQKVMKYRDSRVVSGYALLAGEFDSIDHPSIPQILERVKTFQSKTLASEASEMMGVREPMVYEVQRSG